MAEPTTLIPLETMSPVAVTTSAALTGAVGTYHESRSKARQFVRVRCTVDVCLKFSEDRDADPTATTDDMELSANQHEYFDVLEGTKISAIRASSATGNGVLKVTLCGKR